MKLSLPIIVAVLVLMAPSAYAVSGSIWTTNNDCGDESQDVNHYTVGETVFVNGKNFAAGSHAWSINGQPGGASADPNIVVASGNVVVGAPGTFCFAAYVVAGDDRGEYKVKAGNKQDNYRVNGQTAENLSCEQALAQGLLVGSVNGHQATVTNNAGVAYDVSLVSYKMYAALIDDQTYFDSETKNVKSGKTVTFDIDVPACGYQLDLVCGEPIVTGAPYYGGSVIDSLFANQGSYCTHVKTSSSPNVSATLTVAPYFPQNKSYVFICTANGFSATSYNWYYGDGQILYNTTLDNTFHTYASGNFTVACTAVGATDSATDVMPIVV